jgi:hypothetical protein
MLHRRKAGRTRERTDEEKLKPREIEDAGSGAPRTQEHVHVNRKFIENAESREMARFNLEKRGGRHERWFSIVVCYSLIIDYEIALLKLSTVLSDDRFRARASSSSLFIKRARRRRDGDEDKEAGTRVDRGDNRVIRFSLERLNDRGVTGI